MQSLFSMITKYDVYFVHSIVSTCVYIYLKTQPGVKHIILLTGITPM